ncbi:amino acid ABC transporter ATP-binding protein [Streptomyces puniciscabiei]
MDGETPLLRITNLRKSYGGREVLKGVDMTVNKGETVAVIGASGSGKSTMLRCINCLETPDGGSVHLRDQLIGFERHGTGTRQLTERKLASQRAEIGMLFQNFNLFPHWTVLKNVTNAPETVRKMPKEEAIELGLQLLDRVGLQDRAGSYPKQLSGGQQQRVAIARALAMKPQLLLFDEPTSALDPANVGEVTAVMRQLAAEGTTMIVVTHEIGFARAAADRVVFVYDGRIIEDGPARQVLEDPQSELTKNFLLRTLH